MWFGHCGRCGEDQSEGAKKGGGNAGCGGHWKLCVWRMWGKHGTWVGEDCWPSLFVLSGPSGPSYNLWENDKNIVVTSSV